MNHNNIYELHIYEDPSFPFLFHADYMLPYQSDFLSHWHENIEILCVTKGEIIVMSDSNVITASKGDIVFINSNNVHHIHTNEHESEYDCLIIDRKFCSDHGLDIDEIIFESLVSDSHIIHRFRGIKEEFCSKKVHHKIVIKSLVVDLLIQLYRNYRITETALSHRSSTEKKTIIKKAIKYIQDNYQSSITVGHIADEVGLSKYYFCRIFKEFTGTTTVNYINILRSEQAKKLLQEGTYRVEEVANLCGFENLSYFTKTYKKYMGVLPSHVKKTQIRM